MCLIKNERLSRGWQRTVGRTDFAVDRLLWLRLNITTIYGIIVDLRGSIAKLNPLGAASTICGGIRSQILRVHFAQFL